MKISYLTIVIIFISFQIGLAVERGNLTVNIEGVETNDGQMIVDLHNIADAFPMDRDKAYRQLKTKIINGKASVTFENIDYDKYAIAAHHDEDGDGEVDTNFIGMPSEDLKASKNASGSFGPPDFEDAMIYMNKKNKSITIYFDR